MASVSVRAIRMLEDAAPAARNSRRHSWASCAASAGVRSGKRIETSETLLVMDTAQLMRRIALQHTIKWPNFTHLKTAANACICALFLFPPDRETALKSLSKGAIPLFDLRPSLRPDPAMQTTRRAQRRSRPREPRAPMGLAMTGGSTAAGFSESGEAEAFAKLGSGLSVSFQFANNSHSIWSR